VRDAAALECQPDIGSSPLVLALRMRRGPAAYGDRAPWRSRLDCSAQLTVTVRTAAVVCAKPGIVAATEVEPTPRASKATPPAATVEAVPV